MGGCWGRQHERKHAGEVAINRESQEICHQSSPGDEVTFVGWARRCLTVWGRGIESILDTGYVF